MCTNNSYTSKPLADNSTVLWSHCIVMYGVVLICIHNVSYWYVSCTVHWCQVEGGVCQSNGLYDYCVLLDVHISSSTLCSLGCAHIFLNFVFFWMCTYLPELCVLLDVHISSWTLCSVGCVHSFLNFVFCWMCTCLPELCVLLDVHIPSWTLCSVGCAHTFLKFVFCWICIYLPELSFLNIFFMPIHT